MDKMSVIVKTTMPEDGQTGSVFADLLNEVDDPEFDKTLTRSKSGRLKSLLNLLQNNEVPTKEEAEQLLNLCTEDDRNCLTYEVAIIAMLLKNTQLIDTLHEDILVLSALFLLDLLKNVLITTMKLRSITINTILSYPDTVLIKIVMSHGTKLIEVIDSNHMSPLVDEIKMEVFHLLKVLTILPSAQAKAFVKQGVSTWLQQVIPMTMCYVTVENAPNKVIYIEYLELLTDSLVTIDYFKNPNWINVLECICNVKKYPSILKKLLDNNSDIWHRLWIVIIKLLNNQITKNIDGFGTPINLMLPVVESAFKMQAAQRIRAFDCWNKLIDNFSLDTNENHIAKRIKLLIMPLKPNNAKTEDIALAKFNTWWHLIRSFEFKLERLCNDVLMPFLHFTFGKPAASKPSVTAIQLSNRLKRKSLEAFVEIVGHTDCECLVDLPKLKSKILNMKLLVNNWNDWMHCLSNAFKNAGNPAVYEVSTKNYLKCTWKTMVQLIAELPDNAVRRDIFTEMLHCVLNMLQEPQSTDQLHDVIVTAIMSSLFDGSAKMQDLLKTKTDKYKPLFMITSAFTNISMKNYYLSFTEVQLINLFKPITKLVLEEAVQQDNYFFDILLPNDISLKFWAATVDNLSELKTEISSEMLSNLMEWPLKSLETFKEAKNPGMKWYSAYNVNHKKLIGTEFNKEVSRYITPSAESVNYFAACVTIAVLKQRLLNNESPGFLPKLLENFTSSIKDYEEFKELIPLSVDTIVVMLNNVAEKTDTELAKTTIACAINILRVIINVIEKNQNDNKTTDNLSVLLINIKKAVSPLMKENAYTDSMQKFVEAVSSHLVNIRKESPLHNCVVTHMKTYMFLTNNTDLKEKISKAIEPNKETKTNNQNNNIIFEPVKVFTTPVAKKVKNIKKAEVNIVNKVVENGEEYIVVKSNWKFNPKKLTENQKEKLQRKREDIPALYQDLSQSQDEIKFSTWKIDSQNSSNTNSTSTTTSKSIQSASDNKVKTITALKNLPNTDMVPKIMENILQETDKKIEIVQGNDTESTKEKTKKNGSLTPHTVKLTKSPRMALKDRVFRNMKNLLEKSTPPTDKTEIDPDHTENIPKTPPNRPKNDMNVANSAPPMLAADRPSRMKRRPKKFDDTELFALKKRRHSQNGLVEFGSQNGSQNDLPSSQIDKSENVKISEDVVMEESEQKTVENDSNKTSELNVVKDNAITEPSQTVGIETKNIKKDSPSDRSKVANADVVNEFILESNNGNDVEQPVAVLEKEPDVIKTIVISESEAFTEPKDVPDGVVMNGILPGTKPECNVIVHPETTTEIVEKLPETPTHKIRVTSGPKSSSKKSAKKSRIEKELAIDMVEGHPFLKLQTEQRLTRKKIIETELTSKRRSVAEKLNKTKSMATPKSTKKIKEKKTSPITQTSITVHETQEASQSPENVLLDEPACSEDVIESSQDSTITTISVKSNKKTTKRQLIIAIERMNFDVVNETQNLLQDSDVVLEPNKTITEEKDDTVLPQNKTVEADRSQSQLTENMDTEPISEKDLADDVIIINDNAETPIIINSEPIIGHEAQEIAEADTQPNNPVDFIELENTNVEGPVKPLEIDLNKTQDVTKDKGQPITEITITENRPLQADSLTEAEKESDLSSPFKDYDQRKKDFLSNTLEISPIKIQSPDRDKKSPSPETSNDYVVIKLSSPVHCNGEPFEKHGSPEFFTDDKISPDKRDVSPPRAEISIVNNTSPSSSLSLKKNKPQVRPGGRAAHMLGLCVPEKLNTMKMADRSEPEELKKASTPARRNLRVLYNTVTDNNESTDNEESENFLKLKRSLPSVDSSPSGPILKRKLCDITDEATTSPASKRKRVSFHDPPVSTTVSVHKYIEPIGLRSPQNSTQKRLERQTRQSQYSKSPKRLDNVFKLETVLSKTIESFTEGEQPTPLPDATPEDTQTSLEVTPAIEIVKTSDLNDTDPIFPKLVNCNDPIIVIAAELSSPSLKHLFVKQVEDTVKTVGDLAKMTEVDVCRLCIKAPKVKIAKKVLSDYAAKIDKPIPVVDLIEESEIVEPNPVIETEAIVTKTSSIEIQTDEVSHCDIDVQTIVEGVATGSTQTDALGVAHVDVQTNESGSKTTADLIATCINEREDFIEKLKDILDDSSIRKVAEKLPKNTVLDVLLNKESHEGVIDKILIRESQRASGDKIGIQKCMSFMLDFMSQRFRSKDLLLFCSQLLKKVHDRSS